MAVVRLSAEEEHFRLGQHLHATGILSLGGEPAYFRPPGFPAFVALVLHLRDAVAPGVDDRRATAFGHACLLSLGGLALFLHASRSHPLPVAFAAGALFSLHPLNLLIARNLTYYTLHIVLVTAATVVLARALSREDRPSTAWIAAAGALWGAATLVRPVSLLLPPFILLLARWEGGQGSGRRALRFTGVFTLAMGAVIAPYTLRNYRVTHRLVLVNAQEGYQLWGLSTSRNPGGDAREWMKIWREDGERLFGSATGGSPYSIEALNAHATAVNDAFRAETLRNLRRHPERMAYNVAYNFFAFNRDYTHWWLERLGYVREGWDWPPRVFIAQLFGWSILVLALLGVARGLREGETDARVVAALYCMFWAAHCLTILMTRYTYVRFPLVLLAFPLGLRRFEKHPVTIRVLLVAVVVAALSALEITIR